MEKFTVSFCENDEIMCCHVSKFPAWRKNPLGTWLLDILNCDMQELENIIQRYPVRIRSDSDAPESGYLIDTPPTNDQYLRIVSDYDFISAYSLLSWRFLFFEIMSWAGSRCLRDIVRDTKELIQFLNEKQECWNYEFLSRYVADYVIDSDCVFSLESYAPDSLLTDEEYSSMVELNISSRLEKAWNHYTTAGCIPKIRYKYTISKQRLTGIVLASLFEVSRSGKIVKQCKNCGKYFIPKNRSDTLYCDSASPQDPTLTCMQYGSRRLWYERQKDDELATLSRNILSAKSMLAKRNPDIEEHTISYNYFREERKKWKKAVEKGDKSREEYREWLILMQSQKVIKEAINGNSRENPE